jgi:hypothetical protein
VGDVRTRAPCVRRLREGMNRDPARSDWRFWMALSASELLVSYPDSAARRNATVATKNEIESAYAETAASLSGDVTHRRRRHVTRGAAGRDQTLELGSRMQAHLDSSGGSPLAVLKRRRRPEIPLSNRLTGEVAALVKASPASGTTAGGHRHTGRDRTGARTTVSVHPERVVLDTGELPNTFDAFVEKLIYLSYSGRALRPLRRRGLHAPDRQRSRAQGAGHRRDDPHRLAGRGRALTLDAS